MTEVIDLIADLRAEIDRIDDAAHDLFMRRAQIVQQIAQAKAAEQPGAPVFAMRPGREAMILRRLMARHAGSFPAAAIAGMWRELIAASCAMQGPFEAAVFGSGDPAGYYDLARSHFGSVTPVSLHNTAAQVLQRVAEGKGVVGLLPLPAGGDPGADWWPALAYAQPGGGASGRKIIRIAARLPFLRGAAQITHDAVLVAPIDREETGNDRSFLLAFCRNEMSRAAVRRLLFDNGVESEPLDTGKNDKRLMLFEAPGYIADDDPRLTRAAASPEKLLERVVVAGGYAAPLQLPS